MARPVAAVSDARRRARRGDARDDADVHAGARGLAALLGGDGGVRFRLHRYIRAVADRRTGTLAGDPALGRSDCRQQRGRRLLGFPAPLPGAAALAMPEGLILL